MPSSPWTSPSSFPVLDTGHLHVWQTLLDLPDVVERHLETYLSKDERDRADRFHFPHDRAHFVAARGALRHLIGLYLNRPPQSLDFHYGPKGKPALQDPSIDLQFNVSHSGGRALIAFASQRAVGVDIERVRPETPVEEIAERFFSVREVEVLFDLPASERRAAFFRCWTRKEAFIKARGDGLSLPLAQFDVTLTPDEPTALLRTAWNPKEVLQWRLFNLDPAPNYMGALAVECEDAHISCWRWSPELG